MTFFMRYPDDNVHIQCAPQPSQTLCGLPLAGAKEVTEAQVVVHKKNARCATCRYIDNRPAREDADLGRTDQEGRLS